MSKIHFEKKELILELITNWKNLNKVSKLSSGQNLLEISAKILFKHSTGDIMSYLILKKLVAFFFKIITFRAL